MGNLIDGEVNGDPSPTATGDDGVGGPDDGVRVVSNGGILQPGVNLLEVTVFGFGGVLTGWVDWNKNMMFEEAERIIWRNSSGNVLGGEADLVQGSFTLQVIAPANMAEGFLGARFRWGEPGLNFFGPAMIGEVEDYFFTALTAPVSGLSGDYNNDGIVDMGDFVVWRQYQNTNTYLPNDDTPGSVSDADFTVWQNNFGMTAGAGAGAGQLSTASSEFEPAPADSPVESEAVGLETLLVASAATGPAVAGVSSAVVVVAAPAAPVVATVDSAAEIFAEAASVVSPLAIDLAVIGGSSTSFDAASKLTHSDPIAAIATDSHANLLLLDEALADLEIADDNGPLADRFRTEEENVGDLELAAVFADESTNWWGV